MMRCRICLWLIVALAVPAQSIAAYAQRLPCHDQAGSAAPAVVTDCHSAHQGKVGHAAGQPDCCGDSCPDMTACAAPHAAGPSTISEILPAGHIVPLDRYAVALTNALFAPPFRPPVVSHA